MELMPLKQRLQARHESPDTQVTDIQMIKFKVTLSKGSKRPQNTHLWNFSNEITLCYES
jgi:hypothetical protein